MTLTFPLLWQVWSGGTEHGFTGVPADSGGGGVAGSREGTGCDAARGDVQHHGTGTAGTENNNRGASGGEAGCAEQPCHPPPTPAAG